MDTIKVNIQQQKAIQDQVRTPQFDRESFIGFLIKVSILHESDMDEINKFSDQIQSEDDALYHLSDYFERLGDTEHFENAEKTLESYKNYLLYGEITDENDFSQDNKIDLLQQQVSTSNQSPLKQRNELFHHLHHEPSEINNQDAEQQENYSKVLGTNQLNSRLSQNSSPNYRQRYDQSSQIHERLYQQAFNKQEFQILMGEIKKEQEIKECTFSPNISASFKSKSPSRQQSQQGNNDLVFSRLSQKRAVNMKDQLSSWQKREEIEFQKCTFHPKINLIKNDSHKANSSGPLKQNSQDKVFERLYNKYGTNSEQGKQNSNNMYKNTQIKSQKNMVDKNSNMTQKEKDMLDEEQMITPAKLKNKKDFLKWQNWNQQNEDNSEINSLNSGSQYQQQYSQLQNNSNIGQRNVYRQQNHSRNITPVKLYGNQYRSASPISKYKQENKSQLAQGSDYKQAHERLYDLHFQRLNNQLVKEVENNFMQKKELTFKPEIFTQKYREKYQFEDQENQQELYQRLYDKAEIFQQRLDYKKKEKEDQLQQELKNCHPQINKKSEIIFQQSYSSSQQSAYERLYVNSKQKEKNFEKLKQKVSQEEGCTFKPVINQYHTKNNKMQQQNKNLNDNGQKQHKESKNLNNFQEQIANIINKSILKNGSFSSQAFSQNSQRQIDLQNQENSSHQNEQIIQNYNQNENVSPKQQIIQKKNSVSSQTKKQDIDSLSSIPKSPQQQIRQNSSLLIKQYEDKNQINQQAQLQPSSTKNKNSNHPFNIKKNNFFS
ncbi:hypothetical protein TTHERM_00933400 (macronuclear) [Tetrahymena thermophila SB210]|uniref:Uncharacterized protein n=1 Tax=Tetrahymena thermophila (strain SB210) TaxID=312017 RepID=I7MLC2_TETTS|nr:hypothetical protein TTHERM_00933400 [Tetrahymena thermophila SB210]EAS01651.1 hypothetical protein TTHERM_00933400 [Tetrahymena thermophila SB210]|eukprot:XP_001021896.1 hypothetical protein TTHERM_00933400 [Tetrahymena thermophila SB210]